MLFRSTLFLCSFLLIAFQQKCNLMSPESIKEKTESELRAYFPNVIAIPLPEKESIVALTCTQGIGPELLHQLQEHIAQDRKLAATLALAQLIHYRYFLLYFDTGMIQYDVAARQVTTQPVTDAVLEDYKRRCGF